MKGLNIHLKSFKLNQNLVSSNDKVRVSITTFPEGNKEAFITEAKQMNSINHDFKVNITDKTQDIIVVFRKMEILQDPIIASTTISSKELPTTLNKAENKSFEIYEPAQKSNKDRHVFGQMQIQFKLTSAFPVSQSKENNQQKNKTQKNFYSELDEKNEEIPYSVFLHDD